MKRPKRIHTFQINAESIQGIEDAELTCKTVKQKKWDRYIKDPDYGDSALVRDHIVGWKGIVGENDKELPSPADDPEVFSELYMYEIGRISVLVAQGPDGSDALKN